MSLRSPSGWGWALPHSPCSRSLVLSTKTDLPQGNCTLPHRQIHINPQHVQRQLRLNAVTNSACLCCCPHTPMGSQQFLAVLLSCLVQMRLQRVEFIDDPG